jgi:hypothetical protein
MFKVACLLSIVQTPIIIYYFNSCNKEINVMNVKMQCLERKIANENYRNNPSRYNIDGTMKYRGGKVFLE